ncbi:MAG: plasmid mobilization protein [Varibaculum cambriense]
MSRRQPNARGSYTRIVKAKVTESDYEKIASAAQRAGMSIAAWIVKRTATDPKVLKTIDVEGLAEAVTQLRIQQRTLAGMANNLNQLAHWANANEAFPATAIQFANVIDTQRKRCAEVVEALRELLP